MSSMPWAGVLRSSQQPNSVSWALVDKEMGKSYLACAPLLTGTPSNAHSIRAAAKLMRVARTTLRYVVQIQFAIFIFYLSIWSWWGCELVWTATIRSRVASAAFLIRSTGCCEVIRAATFGFELEWECWHRGWFYQIQWTHSHNPCCPDPRTERCYQGSNLGAKMKVKNDKDIQLQHLMI